MSTENEEPAVPTEDPKREWMIIAVGLSALMSVLAIAVAVAALSSTSSSANAKTVTVTAAAAPASTAAAAAAPIAITMRVKADDEHARKGPDGQWHDAFLPGDVTVKAGSTVSITFVNYDGSAHSFNSPSLGVNQVIPAGSATNPNKVTVTFKAPTTAGSYQWFCALPCDPWAMSHDGYMRGFVKVVA